MPAEVPVAGAQKTALAAFTLAYAQSGCFVTWRSRSMPTFGMQETSNTWALLAQAMNPKAAAIKAMIRNVRAQPIIALL